MFAWAVGATKATAGVALIRSPLNPSAKFLPSSRHVDDFSTTYKRPHERSCTCPLARAAGEVFGLNQEPNPLGPLELEGPVPPHCSKPPRAGVAYLQS